MNQIEDLRAAGPVCDGNRRGDGVRPETSSNARPSEFRTEGRFKGVSNLFTAAISPVKSLPLPA